MEKLEFIVPTFDTKVTEYLCSGWVIFSSDKFRLFNENFFISFERYCCPDKFRLFNDKFFLYHSKGIVVLTNFDFLTSHF